MNVAMCIIRHNLLCHKYCSETKGSSVSRSSGKSSFIRLFMQNFSFSSNIGNFYPFSPIMVGGGIGFHVPTSPRFTTVNDFQCRTLGFNRTSPPPLNFQIAAYLTFKQSFGKTYKADTDSVKFIVDNYSRLLIAFGRFLDILSSICAVTMASKC